MSEESNPRKPDKRAPAKGRPAIVVLAALVVVLLGVVLWLAFRVAAPRGDAPRGALAGGVSQRLAQLPGVQFFLSRLDLDWAGIPTRGRRLLEQGAALEQEGKLREALQVYQQALEALPDQVEPHLALARAHEALGEGEEALAHLEAAVELDPEDARAQRELGRALCLSGDVETCTQALQTAVDLAPDDPQGHYWLGLAYQQGAETRVTEAERAYLRALQLEPDSAKAHLALGGLYQARPGMEAQALERIHEALRLAVQAGDAELEAKAHEALARYYYAQDNYDLCVQEWQTVLEENPEDEDALRRLGLCFAMRRNEGDLERAIASIEQSIVLDVGQMDAYYFYLGQYYASQQEYTRAFFAWDQFLRFSEDEELKATVRSWLETFQEAMQEEGAP